MRHHRFLRLLPGIVAALLGDTLLTQDRLGSGSAILVLGLAWTSLVKYSTGLPLAVLLLMATLAIWSFVRARGRGLLVLGGISALTVAVLVTVSQVLSLPGLRLSAQDTFTHHFAHPDVPNVWQRLIDANVAYWLNWPNPQTALNLATLKHPAARRHRHPGDIAAPKMRPKSEWYARTEDAHRNRRRPERRGGVVRQRRDRLRAGRRNCPSVRHSLFERADQLVRRYSMAGPAGTMRQ
jgi:hypothetical protein